MSFGENQRKCLGTDEEKLAPPIHIDKYANHTLFDIIQYSIYKKTYLF